MSFWQKIKSHSWIYFCNKN